MAGRTNQKLCTAVVTLGFLAGVGFAPAAPVPADRAAEDEYEAAVIAAIHLFVQHGEEEHLKTLLDRHPKLVNERRRFRQPHKPGADDHYTPLQLAVRCDRAGVVAVLLARKAEVNTPSDHGWTPLHVAARNGNLAIVKLLVEAGAKTDAKTEELLEREVYPPSPPPGVEQKPIRLPAQRAMTPLEVAVEAKKADVAEYLRSVGR